MGILVFKMFFVLERAAPKMFPDFEHPSDLSGPEFNRFDTTGRWKEVLKRRATERGLI